jgi:hypothetical protein
MCRRERKDDYYIQNRQSANFSSSGHPIRPPRSRDASISTNHIIVRLLFEIIRKLYKEIATQFSITGLLFTINNISLI